MADQTLTTVHEQILKVRGLEGYQAAGRSMVRLNQMRTSAEEKLARAAAATERAAERKARADQKAASSTRASTQAVQAETAALRAAAREIQAKAAADERLAAAERRHAAQIARAERQSARQNAIARRPTPYGGARVTSGGVTVGGFAVGAGGATGGAALLATAQGIRDANGFEVALRDAGAAGEVTGRQLQRMGQITRRVGLETRVGALDATKAAGELVKAGSSVGDLARGQLKATLDLSRAGDVAADQAAITIAKVLGTFQKGVDESAHVADVITHTAGATTTSVDSMNQAFVQAAGAANLAKVPFEDLAAWLALLAKNGQEGSDAGTSIRTALTQLSSEKATKLLKERNIVLYDQNGQLKSLAELSDELGRGTEDLNAKQKTNYLQQLVGQDAYRSLAALLSTNGKGVRSLSKELTEQGYAAKVAEQRTAGLEGQMRKLAAVRQEIAIATAGGLLPGLSAGAEAIADALQTPGVQKALDRIGRQLGEEGERLADGFARAAENGDLERFIGGITAAAGAAVDVTGDLATILGALAKAYSSIPQPARDAATATLVYFAAARRLSQLATMLPGLGGLGGGAGGSGGTGGFGGGFAAGARGAAESGRNRLEAARALAEQRRALQQQQVAAAAELAAARAEVSRRQARADLYGRAPSITVDDFGGTRRRQRERQAYAAAQAAARAEQAAGAARSAPLLAASRARALQALRAERAAAEALRTAPGRLAQLGELSRGIRTPGLGAGAAVGGVTGSLLAKDFLSAVAGPWGAAGGAVASAAGFGLKKYLQTEAKKDALELGREIARGAGEGLSKETQAALTDAKREVRDARKAAEPKVLIGAGGAGALIQPGAAELERQRRADEQFGTTLGKGFVQDRLRKTKFFNEAWTANELLRRTEGESADARAAAAKQVAAYIRELEKNNPKMRGAAQRFAEQFGAELERAGSKAVSVKLRIETKLEDNAGEAKRTLENALKRQQQLFPEVAEATDTTFEGIVKTARRRMGELALIMNGATGATVEEREAAQREYRALGRAIDRFSKDAGGDMQAFAGNVRNYMGSAGSAVGSLRTKILSLKETISGIDDAIAKSPAFDPTSQNFLEYGNTILGRQNKAAGGAILGAGGWPVPVALSPGEVVRHAADGTWSRVPGVPISADSVHTYLQPNDEVFTFGGQAMLGAGASIEEALATQPRHFYGAGGRVPQRLFAGGVVTTSYGPPWNAMNGTGVTAGGTNLKNAPKRYIVAVDPKVIPLGSHVKVTPNPFGYTGSFLADDTGGAIKGNRIDFYDWRGRQSQMNWGRRNARAETGARSAGSAAGSTPISVARSRRGRLGLVADAFGQGFERGAAGYSRDDLRQFGNPVMRQILEELAGGTYRRERSDRSRAGSRAGFGWPVSNHTVSSGFGPRKAPTSGASSYHDGVDFPVRVGTAVRAIANGTVTRAGANGGYGQYVGVQHAGGYFSGYGHLSKILARQGAKVRRGQQIALSGNTGTSTGPHLHLQLHKNGQKVDPLTVLGQRMGAGGYVGRRRMAAGGTPNTRMRVSSLGGVSVTSAIRGRGSSSIERLAEAAESVTFRRVERTIAELEKVANAPGSKLVSNRARAAMSALEGTLGARVGRVVAQAGALTARRDTNLERTRQVQILRGIDPESARGIGGQMLEHQRFLDQAAATGQERQLEIAVERARRGDQRSKQGQETLRAAEEALEQFRDGVMTSRVALKELEQQQRDAARSFREAMLDLDSQFAALTMTVDDDVAALRAQAAEASANAAAESDPVKRRQFELAAAQASQQADRQARRAAFPELDFKAAEAALTKSTDDDRQVAQERAAALAAAIEDALNRGDRADVTDLRNELASVNSTLETLAADQKARDDARQEIAERKARAAEMEARHLLGLDAGEAMLALLDQRLRPAADRLSGSPTRWMR